MTSHNKMSYLRSVPWFPVLIQDSDAFLTKKKKPFWNIFMADDWPPTHHIRTSHFQNVTKPSSTHSQPPQHIQSDSSL